MSITSRNIVLVFSLLCVALFNGCEDKTEPVPELTLSSLQLANESLLDAVITDAGLSGPIIAGFSESIDTTDLSNTIQIVNEEGIAVDLRYNVFNTNKTISIYPQTSFETYTTYTVVFNEVTSESGSVYTRSGFQFQTLKGKLTLISLESGGITLPSNRKTSNIPLDLQIKATFSDDIDPSSLQDGAIKVTKGSKTFDTKHEVSGNTVTITTDDPLDYWTEYDIELNAGVVSTGSTDFEGYEATFITSLDSTLKYPEISDDELLTLVQEQTFKYFWDYAHPTSGLARERLNSGETVTIGGSGFGVMAIIVAIERGFITRQEGIQRLLKIVNFLLSTADRHHGVWPHWLNGSTGATRPFSTKDDGGDLVESAFMLEGLITVRQYLDAQDPTESEIINKINILWDDVEWDWYTQGGQDVLYWHWSPNYAWDMNHKITGWNEAMIVYVLAASSASHPVSSDVYTKGWSRNGAMKNSGNSYYGYQLDLRNDRGGPLFFAHYSFLGLDPRNLSDQYANYWDQNVNHSLINWAYCQANPKNYLGYSEYSWGLTASDNQDGYNAHSPDNDLGVITPTAAISSIPYTPKQSMEAIRQFYYIYGDRLWGNYGFKDAINFSEEWVASSYLAIDQGPIILMIENYRTGLLWDLFMSAPEVQAGLDKLAITYE